MVSFLVLGLILQALENSSSLKKIFKRIIQENILLTRICIREYNLNKYPSYTRILEVLE